MTLVHATTRLWTVKEFHRLFDVGVLDPDERVELIEGEIVSMPAHNPPHVQGIITLTRLFVLACHTTHDVACQLGIELSEYSEPEPDFMLIPHGARGARDPITVAALVVEVADTSLAYDRNEKASLFARYQVTDYWILDVRHGQLEVRRRPAADPTAVFKWSYQEKTVLHPGQTASPLCRPDLSFRIEDMLA